MVLRIPDRIFQQLSLDERQLVLEFAIFMYEREILSMRAAAEFAQISWLEMEEILAEKGISLQFSEEDMEDDLRNLEKLSG